MQAHDKAIIHGSGQSRWRTPPQLFERLSQAVGGFLIDAAAGPENYLCDYWFGPGADLEEGGCERGVRLDDPTDSRRGSWEDALALDWAAVVKDLRGGEEGSKIFFNPPYSKTEIKALRDAGVPADDPRIRALRVEHWVQKAFNESERGVSSVGLLPYAPQTAWFRHCVMGHNPERRYELGGAWRGHAALDYWRFPHRISYLTPDGQKTANAGVNSCLVFFGPNPGFVGPWTPSGRYWSYL